MQQTLRVACWVETWKRKKRVRDLFLSQRRPEKNTQVTQFYYFCNVTFGRLHDGTVEHTRYRCTALPSQTSISDRGHHIRGEWKEQGHSLLFHPRKCKAPTQPQLATDPFLPHRFASHTTVSMFSAKMWPVEKWRSVRSSRSVMFCSKGSYKIEVKNASHNFQTIFLIISKKKKKYKNDYYNHFYFLPFSNSGVKIAAFFLQVIWGVEAGQASLNGIAQVYKNLWSSLKYNGNALLSRVGSKLTKAGLILFLAKAFHGLHTPSLFTTSPDIWE